MSISKFFSSTCRVRTIDGFNKRGRPTGFTIQPAKKCRFDPQEGEKVVNEQGKDVLIDGFVYMLAPDAPKLSDELEIDGTDFRILKVDTQRAFAATHHVKVAVRKKG